MVVLFAIASGLALIGVWIWIEHTRDRKLLSVARGKALEALPLYIPRRIGREALMELGNVPWPDLNHAYLHLPDEPENAIGRDVALCLRRLYEGQEIAADAVEWLYGNIWHQGTIYHATAYAVPFLAAIVAGDDIERSLRAELARMIGRIAIASSFDAPTGSHSGAWGENVAQLTREALVASHSLLSEAASRDPALLSLTMAIQAYAALPSQTTVDELTRCASD